MQRRGHRPGRYDRQAATYDSTRAASPTVVGLVADGLGPALDRTLLDVASGTGNYAAVFSARGFRVTAVDLSPEMLAGSVGKLGPRRQVVADALAPPFGDGTFDAAVLISALHLMADPRRAIHEIRRVVRGGPFVLQAFTKENMEPLFVHEYFEETDVLRHRHPSAEAIGGWLEESGFGSVSWQRYVYGGVEDGSMPALHTDARLLADEAYLRNNSWFNELSDRERVEGLARLRDDLGSGRLAERVAQSLEVARRAGHGTVFVARVRDV